MVSTIKQKIFDDMKYDLITVHITFSSNFQWFFDKEK